MATSRDAEAPGCVFTCFVLKRTFLSQGHCMFLGIWWRLLSMGPSWLLSAEGGLGSQTAWVGTWALSSEPALLFQGWRTSEWAAPEDGHPHAQGLGEDPNAVTKWLSFFVLRLWFHASFIQAQESSSVPLTWTPSFSFLQLPTYTDKLPRFTRKIWGLDGTPNIFIPACFRREDQEETFALIKRPLCGRHPLCVLRQYSPKWGARSPRIWQSRKT